ncbi:inositol monophosphatase family protein [Curtobacterium ammoniigenes]|uniref:inositol monophosphatase family protein n=1 Tax=Curtobacterium ammoniigenes TaxID=395387 RepID=UPI00082E181A|nr:inositol monophosphatase family protein [Curtobacterium ammoniigenes]
MTESPESQWESDLSFALHLADLADAISLDRYRAADLHVDLKADRTHVTDADQAVERALRAALADARPNDAFLGEETAATEGSPVAEQGGRQWIIDPIDGTANYLRGVPVWATLIALVDGGIPRVGVVSAPALGRRWWAATDAGAWTSDFLDPSNPRRIRVSGIRELDQASLSYNSLQQWDDAARLPALLSLARQVWRTRAYGDMWSYMLVAEGALDIAGEPDLRPWDMAALAPIVEEAGGRFSSLDGEEGPWHGSALATNGHLHRAALDGLRGT